MKSQFLEETLQEILKQPLAEILASAKRLDKTTPTSLYQALEEIGFIGCIETDQQLSTTYKQHLNFL
ncbi:MAG: hypothetical protein ACKN9F_00735 [Methylomonas sp.]